MMPITTFRRSMCRACFFPGLIGAFLFCGWNAATLAQEAQADPIKPDKPVATDPASKPKDSKKRAAELIDSWLAPRGEVTVTDDEKAEIAAIIKAFGADGYKARAEASRKINEFGIKAQPQLEQAAASDDPEVSNRVAHALENIKSGKSRPEVLELRKIKKVALQVLGMREKELYQKSRENSKKLLAQIRKNKNLDANNNPIQKENQKLSDTRERLAFLKQLIIDEPPAPGTTR